MRLSQSSHFKAPYERSNEQVLSQSALYLIFYQQNIDKNAMLKNFVSIIRKIYQCDFPKVAVSKRSTTGAMSSSFRRAPCTKPSIRRISAKIQCFGILFQVWQNLSVRLSQSSYLKRSTKGAMSRSFRRAPCI